MKYVTTLGEQKDPSLGNHDSLPLVIAQHIKYCNPKGPNSSLVTPDIVPSKMDTP